MDEQKKIVLHYPENNTEKILVHVSDTTQNRIREITKSKNMTNSALISLAVELFEKSINDITIVM